MARLKDRNGTVVSVADDRVDLLLRSGFTRADEKPAPAKKASKRSTAKAAD